MDTTPSHTQWTSVLVIRLLRPLDRRAKRDPLESACPSVVPTHKFTFHVVHFTRPLSNSGQERIITHASIVGVLRSI